MLSKLDGDARGGAALSVASVTGKPILFASNGEGLKDFEVFHPDRMASRILDMGDIMTLIEQAQKQFDEEEARKAAEKISEGSFGLDDFLDQLQQVRKLGSMKSLLGMIPGMAQHRKELEQFDEREIDRTEAIIRSMTPAERRDPSIINGSRRARIAYGSGVTVSQVNALLQRFEQAAKMMKRMSNRGGMGGGIPGFGGPAMGGGKKKGKNKKKGGKSGNPMKREAEEKALRDKLAGKSSGSTGGSAFAKKPQNPALPAGLEQMMGNVDGGTELPPNLGGAWRTVRSLISQLAPSQRGAKLYLGSIYISKGTSMTTILSAVAIIALLWTTLSALPAGLEARMPLPYMIALTPLLCVPLMILPRSPHGNMNGLRCRCLLWSR